ncbi:MAG TPA: nicotinate-nucleotide adenylyltransferase [Candidatus Limnocylindrales bacterium]|nr:nicotinate-nucleotide adenylyltransferase [Candidatus Limnocylindrales bacterium]
MTERASGGARPAPASTRTTQLGVLGGTFDPIHVGHVAVARAARRELGLDEVLLVPAASPPHKVGVPTAPADDRLAMVELAVANEPGLVASRIELDRPGPSWTVDTLTALLADARAAGRDVALTLILSADAFAGLATWHEPARLLRLARVAVAPRPGHPSPSLHLLPDTLRDLAGDTVFLAGPNLDISATDIRRRVAAGLPVDGLVAPAVARYIEAHHLYRQPARSEEAT